jgi:hypothetical protein
MRGQLGKETRPGRARNVLIGIQVFASALLLICSTIFLRSAIASSRFDPGFCTFDTVVIDVANEPKRAAIVDAIASEPIVAASAALRPGMLAWPFTGIATIGATRTPISYRFVSPEYFDVFDIPIVRGRSFTVTERDGEHPVAIVSDSIARPHERPISIRCGRSGRNDRSAPEQATAISNPWPANHILFSSCVNARVSFAVISTLEGA